MRVSLIRNVKAPTRGTAKSAGLDFYLPEFDERFRSDFVSRNNERVSCSAEAIYLQPHCVVSIPSGVRAEVPEGFALIAFNKSGVAQGRGLDIAACVVDEDYQGEIHLSFFNTTGKEVVLIPGAKVSQFILVPTIYDDAEVVPDGELHRKKTERGAGAFGSTGA